MRQSVWVPPKSVWDRYDRLASRELSTLVHVERRLVALGGLRTEVNNGGFDQYFFNTAGDLAPDALRAAEEVAADLAGLLQRAMRLLGDSYPTDRDLRQTVLSELGDEADEALSALDMENFEMEVRVDLDAAMDALLRR